MSETATNYETGVATAPGSASGITGGDIVVLPQVPGMLSLTYKYTSPSGDPIEETVTAVNLALAKDNATTPATGPAQWEAGKHYIYTITIKANEILIAPTPVDWTDQEWNITVE